VTRTALRSLLVTTGVAVLLAGCGGQAGAAATVDGRRITVSDVQSATVDAQTWVGSNGQVSQSQVLYLLAAAPYIQEIATQYRVGASDADARGVLVSKVPHPSTAGIEVIRANMSLTQLQQGLGDSKTSEVLAEVTKRLAAGHFAVSPRYGSFNASTGRLSVITPNWLESASSAEPSASPSPTP
jgi:hypothetical protein